MTRESLLKALGSSPEMPQEDIVMIISSALDKEFSKDGNKLSDTKYKKIRRYAQQVARALKDKAHIYPVGVPDAIFPQSSVCGGQIKRLSNGMLPMGVCLKCGGNKIGTLNGQLQETCGNLFSKDIEGQ